MASVTATTTATTAFTAPRAVGAFLLRLAAFGALRAFLLRLARLAGTATGAAPSPATLYVGVQDFIDFFLVQFVEDVV